MNPIRRLPLYHAHNVRDLGGYSISESQSTSWNRIYRSDDVSALDESDWKTLRVNKITCILDLRSKEEQITSPYDCEAYGITHVSIPFMKEDNHVKEAIDEEALQAFILSMKLDYVQMFQDAKPKVKEALEYIKETLQQGNAILFHCTAGKDRTGILACILLDFCGVNTLDIIADYQVSATYNVNGINKRIPKELLALPNVKEMFESRVDMMEPLLAFFHETSCEEVLLSIGVSKETMQTIKENFIISINI